MRMRSRHSRRRVAIQRSAVALALGALDDADVGGVEDGVEGAGERGVAVSDEEAELFGAVVEVHQKVACLLSDPWSGGVGGAPGDVHSPCAVLDDDQHVEAAEEDGVGVGEVGGVDRAGLGGRELLPGRPRAAG